MFTLALAIYFLLALALSVVDLLVSNMNADELRDMGVWKKSKQMPTTPDPSARTTRQRWNLKAGTGEYVKKPFYQPEPDHLK